MNQTASQTSSNAGPMSSPLLRPEWTQLPKSSARCPISGLSRSAINALILPTKANGFNPPVKSRSIKNHKHASRGVRLVNVESLLAYIEAQSA